SIALFRAITEAIQARLAYITGVRDDIFIDYYKKMRMNDKKFILKALPLEGKCYANCISLPVKDVNSNVSAILKILLDNHYKQIFVIDHTKPELMIPVVQVFIPSMLLNNSRM
ncbi:MAG TPA: YcaO-like family protein, partial [Aquella sp.]|nr:YcaO-like family protein [Aquella sp.]